MMNPIITAVQVLLFPGLSFILSYTLYAEWLSRKTVARLQNRTGPLHTGWQGILQPLADFIKLLVKEDITTAEESRTCQNSQIYTDSVATP